MQGHLQLQSSVKLVDIAFVIKKFSFYGALFKRILAWKSNISKKYCLEWNCSSPYSLHLPYSKYKGVKICFYSCRYKFKIFHSGRTRVVRVALVSLVYSTRVALLRTRVWLVSLVSHLCSIRVARVWHSLL